LCVKNRDASFFLEKLISKAHLKPNSEIVKFEPENGTEDI